jgi:hypothetical protein
VFSDEESDEDSDIEMDEGEVSRVSFENDFGVSNRFITTIHSVSLPAE